MKITYISSSTIPSRAANSIHVMKMCQAFARNGHDVVLIAPDRKNDLKQGVEDVFAFYGVEKCFEIVKMPWLSIKGWSYSYGILAGIKAKALKQDLVYCRNTVGCFFASLLGLPVILESHAPLKESGRIREWMFRRLIKSPRLQKLVVITHALKEYYVNSYPLTKAKIQVAPDGADPVPENIEPVALSNKGKRLQVGYVGHLYRGRGVDTIIDLAKSCDWADFHLVGGTEKDIGYWRNETVPLKNIIFHGFVSPIDTERLRVAFDILLAPYQRKLSTAAGNNTVSWMSPLKIFEYMSAGKAIVCSNLPVLHEILKQGETTFFCDPEKVEDWHKALVILRDDRELRQRLGGNAQAEFLAKYTWGKRARSVLHYSNVDDLTEATIKRA